MAFSIAVFLTHFYNVKLSLENFRTIWLYVSTRKNKLTLKIKTVVYSYIKKPESPLSIF